MVVLVRKVGVFSYGYLISESVLISKKEVVYHHL